jgi:7-cyano-7-deazaguanine synthase
VEGQDKAAKNAAVVVTQGLTNVSEARATVLLSGGIDSAACAYLLARRGLAVQGLFFDFGQLAAAPEERAATSVAEHLQIPLQRLRLSGPEPYGAGEIPGRNAFFVFASLLHLRGRPGIVALGVHSGTGYYDCSEAFVASIDRLVAEHTDGRVSVIAPFVSWTKQDVYEYFRSTHVPVALTYSCESGTDPPCGLCASCRDRKTFGC